MRSLKYISTVVGVLILVILLGIVSGCSLISFTSSKEIEVGSSCIMKASYYGGQFHGKRTANGELFNRFAMTGAHKTLPFGSILKVTYPKSGRSAVIRINDRGPYVYGRDLDLSEGVAVKIGMRRVGVARVQVRRIG